MPASLHAGVALVIIGVLPGLVLFRLPIAARDKRAALPLEERWFWQVLLSLSWSVAVTLVLAALSLYSFERLLAVNLAAAAAAALVARRRLFWAGTATKPTASVILVVLLAALATWRFTPAAEYIIGGKDPGAYVNEGIAIDRTGTLFRRDAAVAAVPAAQRDLFFTDYGPTEYYGLRFMGVFLNDPVTGEVIAQFPHLLPASIAIGYGVADVRGALSTVVVWSVLGILAVYLFGVRLVGRPAAFLAVILLALNVVEVWYGGYPNAEVVMQAMLFALLLAFSYVINDDNGFFGWVASAFAVLLIFLRFDSYLAIAGIAAAASLVWIVHRRAIGWGAGVLLVLGSWLAWSYYSGPMKAYFWQYRVNLPAPAVGLLLIAAAYGAVVAAGRAGARARAFLEKVSPPALVAVVIGLAVYALFFRHPVGRLPIADAYGLRLFRDDYVFWPALVAGIAGFALMCWRRFWREPAFFMVFAGFCIFFFYRLRVQHEHFWMARRYLPVILPGLLLLAAAAAVGVSEGRDRPAAWRRVLGTVLLTFIGWQFVTAAAPVAAHVEYAGALRQVEKLAEIVQPRDLAIFESRNADSDMHIFALPLAYAYGRNVLVFESPRPDRRKLEAFLDDASQRYERVLFIASAGTDLLSQQISARPVASVPVMLPEYATAAWNEYPAGPRQKDLSYDVYELSLAPQARRGFSLDVGHQDELHVLRFHASETTEGRSFRWTGPQSFVAVTGLAGSERKLILVMHNGGRPPNAPPAVVEVSFDEVLLGSVEVGHGFRDYELALPEEAVRAAAARADPAQLRLRTVTWNPRELLGSSDHRPLGVMVDRVEIH